MSNVSLECSSSHRRRLDPVNAVSGSPGPSGRSSGQRIHEVRDIYLPLLLTGSPLVLSDLVASVAALAVLVQVGGWFGVDALSGLALPMLVAITFGFVAMRTYRVGVSPIAEFIRIANAARLVFAVAAVVVAFQYGPIAAGLLFLVGMPSVVGAVTLSRAASRRLLAGWSWWGVPVRSVESEATISAIRMLRDHPERGLRPVTVDSNGVESAVSDASASGLSLIGDRSVLASLGYPALLPYRSVYLFGGNDQIPPLKSSISELGGETCVEIRPDVLNPISRLLKRAFDLVVTSTLLVLGAPLFVLLAGLVRLSSPGPVFYGQERIGFNGRHFKAWKFRSMIPNADTVLQEYLDSNPAMRVEWESDHKLRSDPRVTRIGRFLRQSSLDELPQLFNVLMGEMSLVGPRPIPVYEGASYRSVSEMSLNLYLHSVPALTGLWQVSGRNNTSYECRVGYDTYYVANWSLLLDVYILMRTAKTVLLREGSF